MKDFCGQCTPKLRNACDEMYLLTSENIQGLDITCPGPVKVDGNRECGILTTAEAAFNKARGQKQKRIGDAIAALYDPKFVASIQAGMADMDAGRTISLEELEDIAKRKK